LRVEALHSFQVHQVLEEVCLFLKVLEAALLVVLLTERERWVERESLTEETARGDECVQGNGSGERDDGGGPAHQCRQGLSVPLFGG
jgi:hypothetical protein